MAAPPFQVKALYDYASKEEDDLNFPNGQIITVTEEEDADWFYGEYADSHGNRLEGLFPKNFVKLYEPETPPRPSRMSRSKRDLEPPTAYSEPEKERDSETILPQVVSAPPPVQERAVPETVPVDYQQPSTQVPQRDIPPAVPSENPTVKPVPPPSKAAAPQAAEKSASGSFRDRINAFNKPTAPPVAPTKPGALGGSGGSSFIKKPFVAPPPSKNAYVPPPREQLPQKIYRRESDQELGAQGSTDLAHDSQITQTRDAPPTEDAEDQPKPTTLKDRIALLQKQQMEQAARHADAGQKKEKPKRPLKKPAETQDRPIYQEDEMESEMLERTNSGDTMSKRSAEAIRSAPRTRRSRERTPIDSPVIGQQREILSDPNDADQSTVGDTEEGDEFSTGRDDSDEKSHHKSSIPPPRAAQPPVREADVGDEEDNAEVEDVEDEGDEEEDVDPELKRRMEIRERMAKMSGGMGMAGMFNAPAGLPSRTSTKQHSVSSEKKSSANSGIANADNLATRVPPVAIIPMPGLQKVRSPERNEGDLEVSKEEEDLPKSIVQGRDPEEMPDVEDFKEELVLPPRRSTEKAVPPPVFQDRPVPAPPAPATQSRAPPPLPTERPVPPAPNEARPVPRPQPPPQSQPDSPSEGSESDDEMSLHPRSSLNQPSGAPSFRPTSKAGPPPNPPVGPPPSLPSRPTVPRSPSSNDVEQTSQMQSPEMSPSSPSIEALPKRSSRVPPVPGSSPVILNVPQNRAPPPPPPANAPLPRMSNGESRPPVIPPVESRAINLQESDEEITEYEGDYDTDMASGATHKDALKSHTKVSTLEDDSVNEDKSLHHPGLPSLGPPPSGASRAVPPPPPQQPPRTNRQSSDMPRAPPPPPPPSKDMPHYEDDDEYDPYRYENMEKSQSSGGRYDAESPSTPRMEESEPAFVASPSQRVVAPSQRQDAQQYAVSPSIPVSGRSGVRQSTDIQRTSTSIRRSTEGPRSTGEGGFIASDIDLGQRSSWWARADTLPPVLQNRRDLNFEIEETNTTRRGGKQTVTKTVYVLFMDYSQTVITAHFEAKDPKNATLEQRHEAPPQALRQDQLEDAHTRFGLHIAEQAKAKDGSVIDDGSPHALVLSLVSSLPDALQPVGVRAYGALVYANLANASVRQYDEIRPGDIVTFRNAKFQGHKGAMHTKYNVEVGKPDHVGVVIDWDGTKKKIRAWEQGRENKKVKAESFKFGDMRSGEVKVWRVMARSWVGWEGQN